jgi:hypothetical protein
MVLVDSRLEFGHISQMGQIGQIGQMGHTGVFIECCLGQTNMTYMTFMTVFLSKTMLFILNSQFDRISPLNGWQI